MFVIINHGALLVVAVVVCVCVYMYVCCISCVIYVNRGGSRNLAKWGQMANASLYWESALSGVQGQNLW
jgi:hypothetical protein